MKLLVTLLIGLAVALPAYATSVLPLSLQQLSQQAVLIFYGTVISNQTMQENDKRIVTLTTFKVDQLIKGHTGPTHTIKQIGGALPGGYSMHVHGVPQYRAGDQYVLFLPQPSTLGFSSPLGLYQGNFSVTEQAGEKIVIGAGRTEAPTSQPKALVSRVDQPGNANLDDFIRAIEIYSAQ